MPAMVLIVPPGVTFRMRLWQDRDVQVSRKRQRQGHSVCSTTPMSQARHHPRSPAFRCLRRSNNPAGDTLRTPVGDVRYIEVSGSIEDDAEGRAQGSGSGLPPSPEKQQFPSPATVGNDTGWPARGGHGQRYADHAGRRRGSGRLDGDGSLISPDSQTSGIHRSRERCRYLSRFPATHSTRHRPRTLLPLPATAVLAPPPICSNCDCAWSTLLGLENQRRRRDCETRPGSGVNRGGQPCARSDSLYPSIAPLSS